MQTMFVKPHPTGETYEVINVDGEVVGYATDVWDTTTIYWIGEGEDPDVARIACEELAHAYAELI